MKSTKTFVLFFCLVAASSCCKKDGALERPAEDCRIISVMESGYGDNREFYFTYDTDTRFVSVGIASNTRNFFINKLYTWQGNTAMVGRSFTTGTTTEYSTDSITLDGRGRCINLRHINLMGTSWVNWSFQYNGDELALEEQYDHMQPIPEISTPTYLNGNMINLQTPYGTPRFEYYTNEEFQLGDFFDFRMMTEAGTSLYPHKNLVKSFNDGAGNIEEYSYEKDRFGRISKVTVNRRGNISYYAFEYACK